MNKNAGSGRKTSLKSNSAAGNTSSGGGLDLSSLFGIAATALGENQQMLNQADAQNGNHGDNMVQMFNMITQVMAEHKGASPDQQLSHASEYLTRNSTSGSSKVYAQGLAHAARQFQGQKSVTPENAMMLVQSLLGGGQPSAQQGGGADMLGSLLGSPGGQSVQSGPQAQNDGIGLGDLLNAGMAFMNAKNQGQDTLHAGLNALIAAGPLGQSSHRQQSGQVIGNALMQAISGMAKQGS